MTTQLRIAAWLITGVVLLSSVCNAAPPLAVAPKGTPVDKERFSKAKLTIKGEVVKKEHVILEKGKEYEYSGSFELTQVDDEAAGHEVDVDRIQGLLGIMIVVDGEKSGYKLKPLDHPPATPFREVITGENGKVPNTRFESPNIIHFSGKLKAPTHIGEHELRIMTFPEKPKEVVYVLTRLIEVVEPSEPKGN
jgi:hypothetical protein